jgi:hypothetical protein
MNKAIGIAFGLYVAGTLWASDTDARKARIDPTPPPGCTIVGNTGPDEGFPVAHCADGSYVYQDLDGNGTRDKPRNVGRWVNARYYVEMH